jgi:Flp pilus assembly protein TadG
MIPKIYITKDEKGQTLVEFALILLLLLTLLFGITEFGRAWYFSNALTNGVRDGARYAATLSNTTSFTAKVKTFTTSQVKEAIPQDNLQVFVTAVDKNNADKSPVDNNLVAGDAVTVTVTYDFEVLTGSIVPFFSGTKTLTRQATMRYEQG